MFTSDKPDTTTPKQLTLHCTFPLCNAPTLWLFQSEDATAARYQCSRCREVYAIYKKEAAAGGVVELLRAVQERVLR